MKLLLTFCFFCFIFLGPITSFSKTECTWQMEKLTLQIQQKYDFANGVETTVFPMERLLGNGVGHILIPTLLQLDLISRSPLMKKIDEMMGEYGISFYPKNYAAEEVMLGLINPEKQRFFLEDMIILFPEIAAIVDSISRTMNFHFPENSQLQTASIIDTPLGNISSKWHTDGHVKGDTPTAQELSALAEMRRFPFRRDGHIRVTIPLPMDIEPGTITKPWYSDLGSGIQSPMGFATAFLSGTTFHISDVRTDKRKLLVLQYK